MRRTFLSALVVFCFMNLSFGQLNMNIHKIGIKTYNEKGLLERFQIRGDEALTFDIGEYIKENDHLERVVIDGKLQTSLLTTIVQFDSDNQTSGNGDYLCKVVETDLKPFLGVWGTSSRKGLDGVDVLEIIPSTSAAMANMTADEDIVELDGIIINDFIHLKSTVLSKEIGDKIELTLQSDSNEYTKEVILGSRGVKTITYKYCEEEPVEYSEVRDIEENLTFTTFPNPTMSFTRVSFNSASEEKVVFSVTDVKGNVIHKETYTNVDGNLSFDYNLGDKAPGTYIFIVQQGKMVHNSKVILMK